MRYEMLTFLPSCFGPYLSRYAGPQGCALTEGVVALRIGKRSLRVSVASALLAAASIPFGAGTAHAAPAIGCFASGHVQVTPDATTSGVWDWSIQGTGTCVGTFRGPFLAEVQGAGTSTGLGLCTGLLVQNLNLNVLVTLLSNSTGKFTTVSEAWKAPITTFPLVTPFVVNKGGLDGAGLIATRVRLMCPAGSSSPLLSNGGLDVATFSWVEL